jgi:hypothetical protein
METYTHLSSSIRHTSLLPESATETRSEGRNYVKQNVENFTQNSQLHHQHIAIYHNLHSEQYMFYH